MAEREVLMMNTLPEKWLAKWIDPELPHDPEARQPAAYLRRRFTVESTENAWLYITCHGLYAAYVNGRRAGDFVLAPGTGDQCRQSKGRSARPSWETALTHLVTTSILQLAQPPEQGFV